MEYALEELLPIVAELTGKWTSGESTSVTYERANQLMEAVLYCIAENEKQNALLSNVGIPAREAYWLGYEKVIEKVKRTQESYNTMVISFCAYGNENYHDTVIKALPGFFRYYDALYAPQNTIITMDYPTLRSIQKVSGIEHNLDWCRIRHLLKIGLIAALMVLIGDMLLGYGLLNENLAGLFGGLLLMTRKYAKLHEH